MHWVIYKLPAGLRELPQGLPTGARLDKPIAALQGRNSRPSGRTVGYRGPAARPRRAPLPFPAVRAGLRVGRHRGHRQEDVAPGHGRPRAGRRRIGGRVSAVAGFIDGGSGGGVTAGGDVSAHATRPAAKGRFRVTCSGRFHAQNGDIVFGAGLAAPLFDGLEQVLRRRPQIVGTLLSADIDQTLVRE